MYELLVCIRCTAITHVNYRNMLRDIRADEFGMRLLDVGSMESCEPHEFNDFHLRFISCTM